MKPEEKPTEVQTPPAPAPQPEQPAPGQVVQQVQYVKMEQSLKGLGGWLIFWMVAFAFSGIGFIMMFFEAMATTNSGATTITGIIFSPLIAIAAVSSVVLIAMTKKIAVVTSVMVFGLSALYTTISVIAEGGGDMPLLVGSILTTWVSAGLFSLYFFVSKRVKETLVK